MITALKKYTILPPSVITENIQASASTSKQVNMKLGLDAVWHTHNGYEMFRKKREARSGVIYMYSRSYS